MLLEETLQDAGVNLTVAVKELEVLARPAGIADEPPWILASPWPLLAMAIVLATCCGLAALAVCRQCRRPKKRAEYPKDGHLLHIAN